MSLVRFLAGVCIFMKPLNKLEDIEKYKNYGILTQPFLPKTFVYDKIITDLKHKQKDEAIYIFWKVYFYVFTIM